VAILQESSQVDSPSGGSLVVIKPRNVVTHDSNRIESTLFSAQTYKTNAGLRGMKEKTPPSMLIEQGSYSAPSADRCCNERTHHYDFDSERYSHLFQETSPLSGASLANSSSSSVQQGAKDEMSVDQALPQRSQDMSVGQDEQSMKKDTHSDGDDGPSVDCDVQSVDIDIQSTNQDKQSIDQDDQSVNQDGENNPFSHLLLFSDDDNNDNGAIPSKTSKKKHRKEKSSKNNRRKKTERRIPNSFIAVRFSSPELKQKLELVQQHMVEMDEKLGATLIPLVKLHVTLMTLQLNDDTSSIEK